MTADFVIDPPPRVSLAVTGSQALFPVHRIYCVGRNYADHAREMGHDPSREAPFFFQKSPDNLQPDSAGFPYPPESDDVQHEIELVVALAKGGSNIAASEALGCVYGYAVGLDMTRRDRQAEAKKLGRPWDVAKAFAASAPCSAIMPLEKLGAHPVAGKIWLKVNGEQRQQGDLAQMIWSVPEIIMELSRFFELRAGDLLFTGTPAGVARVHRGEILTGGIEGVGEIHLAVL